jgi:hypothetical protein
MRCCCRARTNGGAADSPGFINRLVSTRKSFPSLSRRNGLWHCGFAHWLNIFFTAFRSRTVQNSLSTSSQIPFSLQAACQRFPYWPLLFFLLPAARKTPHGHSLCRLFGSICRHPVTLALLRLSFGSYHLFYVRSSAQCFAIFRCRRSQKCIHIERTRSRPRETAQPQGKTLVQFTAMG